MNSLVQWPRHKYWDKAWNPMIGCKPCSPACEHCYAAAWAKRFGQSFKPHTTKQRPSYKGVVFVGNMTDMFGEWLGDKPTNYIGSLINWRSDAIYLWLTKRPENMCEALKPLVNLSTFNHYFGFTAENQQWYNNRIDTWRAEVPYWANRWLSVEPILGPIGLGLRYIAPEDQPFEWVVVGCESGPKRRPCKMIWVESIVKECMDAKIPVFVKQLDINGRCETDINKFPAHLRIRQVPWKNLEEVK